jgi:N-acetylglucosaminyldiphosphoundecaprenol N-acetyl-beta-D-mannosaminyltransferase
VQTKVARKEIIDFPVSTGKYGMFIDEITRMARNKKSSAVYFANVHMYIEAYRNRSFLENINDADIVTADGQPIAWVLRLLYGIKQERVAGMDVLPDLLKVMSREGLPVYFYGGTQEMLDIAESYLKEKYPDLKLAGFFSPPFRPLTEIEEFVIVEKINAAAPAIIFIVLGCPQQEKFIASMKGRINAVMAGIGGALPVAIGMQKRAPVWMRKNGLEWLYRLYKEPARLYKRYVTTNSLFLWIMFKETIRLKVNPFRSKQNTNQHSDNIDELKAEPVTIDQN